MAERALPARSTLGGRLLVSGQRSCSEIWVVQAGLAAFPGAPTFAPGAPPYSICRRLRTDRDAPPPEVRRAMKRNAIFAVIVAAAIVVAWVVLQRRAVID